MIINLDWYKTKKKSRK